MKTKKELIIKSFQNMDTIMLDVLLEDHKTYQDATKEVFIEKVHEAFLTFKKNGDSFLLTYNGYCNADDCENKGCKGYSFVGNHSKNHIDLIFDETEDDVNDIYHCNEFETNNLITEKKNLIFIDIKEDEKADFEPSTDFLIKSQQCKLAFEEIFQYQNEILDKEVYLTWLDKFYSLFKSFDLPPFYYDAYNKFFQLYYKLNELKNYLESSDSAEEALNEFEKIDLEKENDILKWLTTNEIIGLDLTLFEYEYNEVENLDKPLFFYVEGLKINTLDFSAISKFKIIFDDYYWNMLEKYNTLSDEEFQLFSADDKMSNNICSLTYHLNRRANI